MIRPDALPIRLAASVARLALSTREALFGTTTLRGGERVRLVASGRTEVSLAAFAAEVDAVELDPADAHALGSGPLRLVGPMGTAAAPAPRRLGRRLALPPALRRAWALEPSTPLWVEAGSVVFGGVALEEDDTAALHLPRTDVLAAGLDPATDTARLRRDLAQATRAEPPEGPPVRLTGRLVTENDVRQARLRGQRIVVHPGQLVTPAARSLGRELGVLEFAAS